VRVTLTAAGQDDTAARTLVDAAFDELNRGLQDLGIPILEA
jgi:hypothetical protein